MCFFSIYFMTCKFFSSSSAGPTLPLYRSLSNMQEAAGSMRTADGGFIVCFHLNTSICCSNAMELLQFKELSHCSTEECLHIKNWGKSGSFILNFSLFLNLGDTGWVSCSRMQCHQLGAKLNSVGQANTRFTGLFIWLKKIIQYWNKTYWIRKDGRVFTRV